MVQKAIPLFLSLSLFRILNQFKAVKLDEISLTFLLARTWFLRVEADK